MQPSPVSSGVSQASSTPCSSMLSMRSCGADGVPAQRTVSVCDMSLSHAQNTGSSAPAEAFEPLTSARRPVPVGGAVVVSVGGRISPATACSETSRPYAVLPTIYTTRLQFDGRSTAYHRSLCIQWRSGITVHLRVALPIPLLSQSSNSSYRINV